MIEDLKPILVVKPLPIESEYSLSIETDPLKCNDTGSVSCGKPGVLYD
jgi:hypothetical protein